MARKTDWLKLAFDLRCEAERIRDAAPEGVTVQLGLNDYGYGAAEYSVSLHHVAQDLHGYGGGTTPAKALKAAVESLEKARQKRAATPTVTASRMPALLAKTKEEGR